MKLIALRDFRNTHPQIIKIEKAIHPEHVHKGARFEIDEADKDNKQLIAQLNIGNAIGDANDAATCKAIDAEVELEKKRLAREVAK